MKKQLLTILSFGAFFVSNAQITITQADIAPVGFQIFRGTDTTFTETPIGPGGANMSWDFSGILDDTGDTLNLVDPNTLPAFGQFPTSNLGIVFNGATAYTELSANDLRIIGQAIVLQGQSYPIAVSPAEKIIDFPANYGDAYTDSSVAFGQFEYTAQPGIDSVRVKSTKVKQVSIDAWGSLIIPFGTFNVIRIKEEINQKDTIDIHTSGFPPFVPPSWSNFQATEDISTHFSYWANGIGFPVMEVDSLVATGEVNVTWLLQTPQVGLNEFTKNTDTKVFPNPASDNVFIRLGKNTEVLVEIYDLQGKLVQQVNSKGAVVQVNVSKLEKGLYVYKVTANDGSYASQGKIVVSR